MDDSFRHNWTLFFFSYYVFLWTKNNQTIVYDFMLSKFFDFFNFFLNNWISIKCILRNFLLKSSFRTSEMNFLGNENRHASVSISPMSWSVCNETFCYFFPLKEKTTIFFLFEFWMKINHIFSIFFSVSHKFLAKINQTKQNKTKITQKTKPPNKHKHIKTQKKKL